MAGSGQRQTARANVQKDAARWQSTSSRQRARAQPERRSRLRPGAGGGQYYRIEVRPKSGFIKFRTQDVGGRGHIQRVAGMRISGSWATVTWLIAKADARVQNGRLVPVSASAKRLIDQLGSVPVHTQGDRFKALDRRNVPERKKPKVTRRQTGSADIAKTKAARRRRP